MDGNEILVQAIIWYGIVPLLSIAVFLILVRNWYGKREIYFHLRTFIFGFMLIGGFLCVGLAVELIGNDDLIVATRILAQALPLSYGAFVASDGADDEKQSKLESKIKKLEDRIKVLEKENE